MPSEKEPKVRSKTSDLTKWFRLQYAGSINLAGVEGGRSFKKLGEAFPALAGRGRFPLPISGNIRMSLFHELKFGYPLGASGYTCLVMGAEVEREKAHFAYAYWRKGQEHAPPEYMCISPTFDSQDGEYRQRIIRYSRLVNALASLEKDLEPFESAILAMIGRRELQWSTATYPPAMAGPVAATADALRLMVTTFALAMAIDLWEVSGGPRVNHTCRQYTGLMAAISGGQPKLASLSRALNTPDKRPETAIYANWMGVRGGQKIVPMFTREVMQPYDLNLSAWRELAVTQLAGDLAVNFISPSFAIYNAWTYLEGADPGLFENQAMSNRWERSAAVSAAVRHLRDSRRDLRGLAPPGAGGPSANYYTEALGARAYEGIEYAQSHLLMSSVALVHTMEHVGWTLRSLPDLIRRDPQPYTSSVAAFGDPGMAARHLFELAYAAHCLHTKLGLAHTDLHGNNLTLYRWGYSHYSSPDGLLPAYDDPVVAYVAGPRGEADTYIFPAAGDCCCIIDYSRSILGPKFAPRLEGRGRSPQYVLNFYRDQVSRVMRALHRYAPSYVAENENALKAATVANFEAVFPVLCAVDFLAIGRSLGALLADAVSEENPSAKFPFQVAPEAFELARRLEDAGREALVAGLHGLVNPAGGSRAEPPRFPGAAILEEVFGAWAFPRWAADSPGRAGSAQLVDAYNYNGEMKYSSTDYSEYPPWARLDEIERHLGEHSLTDLFERGVEPFLEALRPGARVDVIAERVRVEQESLDGPPVSTMSSWLGV